MKQTLLFLSLLCFNMLFAEQGGVAQNEVAQNEVVQSEVALPQSTHTESKKIYPKIVYLRLLPQEKKEVYVGQQIKMQYSLLLFDGASLLESEFIYENEEDLNKIELLNPNATWKKQEDGSYLNTFIYKIKAPSVTLPTLKIIALSKNGDYTDQDMVKGSEIEAIELGGKQYSGLLAEDVKISHIKAKKYDEENNILVFDIEAVDANLADFKLKEIVTQGFDEEIKQEGAVSKGVFYCIVPSKLEALSFTYFNMHDLQYAEVRIPIHIQLDQVSTQSDLEPKNNFLIFSNLILCLIVLVCLGTAFLLRQNKACLVGFLALACVFASYLLYHILMRESVVIKAGGVVSILPTTNSTTLQKLQHSVEVSVIGKHKEYYKIKLDDTRIGWVKRSDCE
ncbi:hypothetical protein BBW65_00750 [Helicobacter enhydrae]|uniref:Periplasmic protein n=1 Tax=Helicobacter enhydrae TaxID=222136 RepID=A0A1B1U3W3_9HELI|nr:SH3 domain-containing protein [Helicobacter enhydrae]ANV97431.1 hypothetical protein BBW65_00750 [Helicobacter enhydrae]